MKHKHTHPDDASENTVPPETPTPESGASNDDDAQKWDEVPPEAAKTEEKPDPLTLAQTALAELQAKYLYLQAEYQNYRKRVAKDLADARAFAVADTLVPFLTVFEYFRMAGAAAEKSDNLDALKQGLSMIMAEYSKAFDELGVKRLETQGAKFDPNLHDAAANEPSDTVPEGHIIREFSGGFKIGDRLLRPARVTVSSGPAKAGADKPDTKEAGEK